MNMIPVNSGSLAERWTCHNPNCICGIVDHFKQKRDRGRLTTVRNNLCNWLLAKSGHFEYPMWR